MKETLRYVNYYKRALLSGCMHNLREDSDLSLVMQEPLRPAAYLTPMFDTDDPDCTYNRLKFDGGFEGAKLEIIVAASNTLETPDGERTLDAFLADPAVSVEHKVAVLRRLRHVRAANTPDLLLHSLKGRYAWVYVGIYPSGECSGRINGLRLEFPRESFTKYFPEIYREDEFFDRFIAVFQSLYLDLERRVDDLPRLLDYDSVEGSRLAELASWLGIENYGNLFDDNQLRYIIRHLDLFQGKKGTREALAAVIELACGIRPRIVENFQWNSLPASDARKRLNRQLYGEGSSSFCVILDVGEKKLPVSKEQLERLIAEYSPMGTTFQLVCLRRCSYTDTHCYLNVNSVLTTPETATVDGATLGGYITAG